MRKPSYPTRPEEKRKALQDRVREGALDAAAATLAAIHLAKQARAEAQQQSPGRGGPGPFDANLRLPLGDVLFGVAQLQVDFARRLFELNREASRRLLQRVRRSRGSDQTLLRPVDPTSDRPTLCFSIRNHASLGRTLTITALLHHAGRAHWSVFLGHDGVTGAPDKPLQVTVAADSSSIISAVFTKLPTGVHEGDFEVKSHGVVVEQIPFVVEGRPPNAAATQRSGG